MGLACHAFSVGVAVFSVLLLTEENKRLANAPKTNLSTSQ